MAELRAPEQNRLLGQLANMLRATEGDIAAPEFLPKGLDVMGLVRQLMLPSAETVEKLSYGDPLFRMPTQSNIPITADREYLADVVGMIPFGAPAARPSARAMQDLVRQIQTEPPTGAIRPYNREEIKKIDEAILAAKVPEDTYFHGTDKAFKDFRRKDRGLAYYFTPDPMQAASYSGMDVGANIRPVKLDIKKTYRGGDVDEIMEAVKKEGDYYPYTISKMREFVEQQDPHAFHTPSVVKALKKLGYDSFVEYEDGIEQIGVFSAKNVKPSFGGGLLDQPAQSVVETSYRGSHSAPNAETYGATLDSLEGIMPADVYSSRGKRLYGLGNSDVDAEWFAAAFKAKGKPDAEVTVYRAVPKGVKEINSGDWVTTSKTYADMHGENTVGNEYEILSKKVKAKTLSSEGYPYEFGYNE